MLQQFEVAQLDLIAEIRPVPCGIVLVPPINSNYQDRLQINISNNSTKRRRVRRTIS
jgi:hypothetical protein